MGVEESKEVLVISPSKKEEVLAGKSLRILIETEPQIVRSELSTGGELPPPFPPLLPPPLLPPPISMIEENVNNKCFYYFVD